MGGSKHFLNFCILLVGMVIALPTLSNQEFIRETDFGRLNLDDLKPIEPPLKPEFEEKPEIRKIKPKIKEATFLLKGIKVRGAVTISANKLEQAAKDKIGKKVTVSELKVIADTMSAQYRAAGYFLSQVVIPAQEVKDGIVVFQVVEGYIEQIFIDRNKLSIKTDILEKYSSKIVEDHPLKIRTLERTVLLSNDLPGVSIKSYLFPSKLGVGAADLTLRIEDRRAYESFLIYDNRVDRPYGPNQVTAGFSYNYPNLIDKTQLIGRVSSHRTLKLFDLTHTHFVGSNGAYITMEGQSVRARPNLEDLRFTPVIGNTKIIALSLSYPIIKTRARSLVLSSSLDSSNTRSSGERNFSDRIRSLRFSIVYDFIDKFSGSNAINLKLSKGLKLLGASNTTLDRSGNNKFTCSTSRCSGRSDYTKFNLEFIRLQYLPRQFSILFDVEAQWSADRLLASEEFAFGGYRFGRGYQSSSFIGDEGIIGKLEFRYDYGAEKDWLERAQPYVFYDLGYIHDKSATKLREHSKRRTAINHVTADSTGFGARLFMTKHFFTQFEFAKPLSKKNDIGNRKTMTYFSINGSF